MKRIALMVLLTLPMLAQQPRLASDFEIAQMENQLARSRGFDAQVSGHLNLGDVRAARNESSLARSEYQKAYEIAARERLDARRDSSLSRYAHATSYAALAQSKLGAAARAFELLEEAARYASDDAETWNLYASAMRILDRPRKAISAARNAVAIASRETNKPLDLAVYQHALATALIEDEQLGEAERLLVTITDSLRSPPFESLQREVARGESFEVYSSARGDVAAYVSLLNRSQLRLASLYERRGERANARAQYERVLAGRSDDALALAGLARLAESDAERERRYAEAFEANPFSMGLVREYQQHLKAGGAAAPQPARDTGAPGDLMLQALEQLNRGETRAARATLDTLREKFPDNDTVRILRAEAERAAPAALPAPTPTRDELRALLDSFERLTPEQRVQLDERTFTSIATFSRAQVASGQTVLESGTIEGVPFRFTEPTAFAGVFDVRVLLRYRILGATRADDADALLLEPLGVEGAR